MARVTIQDLSEELGLAVSTVSRALSGRGYVAESTRERVLTLAKKVGYVPDLNARSLRSGVSKEIALVVNSLEDPFYAELATGFEKVVRARGYNVILFLSLGEAADEMRVVESLIAKGVAGVAITPVDPRSLTYLSSQKLSVLQLDRIVASSVSGVSGDNFEGGRLATSYLLDSGHEKVAFLIDHTKWLTGRQRLLGYEQAFREKGVALDPSLVIELGSHREQVTGRITELLIDGTLAEATAVFSANSVVGEVFYSESLTQGISIPGDLSLLTYDNLSWTTLVRPAITTVDQNVTQMGRIAASSLIDMIEAPQDLGAAQTTLIAPTLISRDSVRKLTSNT